MVNWGPGRLGNPVSIWMEIAQAPACADGGHVTTLDLGAADMTVKEPG